MVYYLLVQDRVGEALAAFARVNPARVAERLQYDYCAAYLALSEGDLPKARSLAERYANHPVDRWRNSFRTVLGQLDEAEGKAPQVADAEDRAQRQGELAAKEPSFEFTLDNRAIHLTWQNLESVRVNYYLMDVELLFSRNPFVQSFGGQFGTIRPNLTVEGALPAGRRETTIPLPAELARRNVLVEVSAGGKTRALPYYANAMDVRMMENYGQLRVADGGHPLPKVYVKVYARLADGSVKFYKDGYTDLRGRFDYASLSTNDLDVAGKFAVLILSDDYGALVREAAPPKR